MPLPVPTPMPLPARTAVPRPVPTAMPQTLHPLSRGADGRTAHRSTLPVARVVVSPQVLFLDVDTAVCAPLDAAFALIGGGGDGAAAAGDGGAAAAAAAEQQQVTRWWRPQVGGAFPSSFLELRREESPPAFPHDERNGRWRGPAGAAVGAPSRDPPKAVPRSAGKGSGTFPPMTRRLRIGSSKPLRAMAGGRSRAGAEPSDGVARKAASPNHSE